MAKKVSRVVVLGGAGVVGKVACRILAESGIFEKITVADLDATKAGEVAASLTRVQTESRSVDISREDALSEVLEGHDVVFNAAPYNLGKPVLKRALRYGMHYLDLGGVANPGEWDGIHDEARKAGSTVVFGCGATPGLSNVIALHGAREMQEVWSIQIAFASFRPLTLSPGLLATILDEFTPEAGDRFVYEDGDLVNVPPFTRKRVVTFLAPVGPQRVCVVPHEEVFALPRVLKEVEEVTVMGTWRPAQMKLLRTLNDLGLMSGEPYEFRGTKVSARQFVEEHFRRHPIVEPSAGCHFYLWIEVQGMRNDEAICRRFRTRHPDWEESATGQMTGIPAALALVALAKKADLAPGACSMDALLGYEAMRTQLKAYEIEIEEMETAAS